MWHQIYNHVCGVMDEYYDGYGYDQIKINSTPSYPSVRHTIGSSNGGQYEDNLRFEQYGIPAALRCQDKNPYIQDPIEKSQRHNAIRSKGVRDRTVDIALNSCEPGISQMHGGKQCGYASDQRIVNTFNDTCPTNLKIDCKQNGYVSPRNEVIKIGDTSIDTTTLLYMFIFIILIYMCLTFWKSNNDINTAMQGGFQQLRDMMVNRL